VLVARGGEQEVLDDLTAAGHHVGPLLGRGQLVVAAVEDAYTPGGTFDPDALLAAFQALVAQALAEGFTGLRVFGDPAPLLADPDVRARWPSYELRADLLVARLPAVALCGYDLRVVDDAAVELPTAVHRLRLGAGDTPGPGFQLHGTADGALALRGEVDMLYSDTVVGLLGGSAGDLGVPVVDVSSLEFVDVAGMRAIAAAARALPATGVAVEVRGGSPLFRRVWSVLGHDALQRVRLT
jgi:anti-anti-sigma regulatory factor